MSIFYTSTSDGYLRQNNVNYATAHNAATSDGTLFNNLSALLIGQWFYDITSKYYVYRSFIYFNTSTIGADAVIISATLTLYTNSKEFVDTDFNIVIRSGMPDCPEDPFVTGDYLYSQYSDNGGSINTADCSATTDAPNIITLNETGRGWINKIGLTKFALISSRDIDSDIPDKAEYMSFGARTTTGGTTFVAKLTVNFFIPTAIPTVTTINLACEDRQATTLTAVGEITGTGDGYTFRGFEYYQYGEGEYDSSMWAVREIGRFHTLGEFRMTLYGLKPLTCYWIRAFAGNVFGIGYGEWVICCTIAGSPSTYDVYTEPNTARYRLYVSDDEAIAWRGYKGPYSGKQQNINISDITNKTKGIKVLKIDLPDANTKGNFHVCITVKQELKG